MNLNNYTSLQLSVVCRKSSSLVSLNIPDIPNNLANYPTNNIKQMNGCYLAHIAIMFNVSDS